ncbi:serpin peptidase inhibitor, clade F (alpha-2 antiplasmin, pigment epithelium derived factor), member 2, transcript variant X1 [Columba livia]|uniref:Serpin peptidase inhibitor, clade F (Alpha-2 antiplasmin, pigment epithelium derived factor), member 2, transcript variant X1 n=2 Tax=Columba livia TaxID=8932 RepID=A0A2I0M204_COLLI|nr:alpha-2-antiplasmin isoform X1 [Columba livia]PKK23711.1 serpin peptidase inhibitor, clade F (alpha-2 antiplasmin, pigment epithelium derived factor), member 2, transcript variant X1 [Columba livia]
MKNPRNMVFLWALVLLCLSALHSHLRFSSAHALEQKHLFLEKDGELKDVKSAGVAESAVLEAVPTLPNADLADFTYDSFQEIDGPRFPFITPPPGMRNGRNPEDEAVAGAVGCHEQQPAGESASSEEKGEAEDESCEMTWKKSQRLAGGLMRFSINLLREAQVESNGTNVILSPLSIALALSHLALGAANQTEKHLLAAMHLQSVPCLHHVLGTLRRRFTESTLSLASRLYLQKGFEVKDKFLEDSEKFYGAKPMTLSGMGEDDLVAINTWVKEATNGQIPTFLQQLPANTVLLLLNAIHFHGVWRNKFDANFTGPDVFHLDSKFMVPVEMMKAQRYPLSWFTLESQDIQVAKFPFQSNMSFVVIVPNQYTWNLSHVLENFPYEQLCRLFPREVPTTVKIPKIKLDYQLELNKVLSQMGLQELFTSPNLQKISDEPLFVSSVQHQSTLELKEDGVEASAATSVAVSRSVSAFSLDQPFVFIIFEDETGIPLFIGSVQNPNPNAAPQIKEPRDSHKATDVNEYPMPK